MTLSASVLLSSNHRDANGRSRMEFRRVDEAPATGDAPTRVKTSTLKMAILNLFAKGNEDMGEEGMYVQK
eukprot:CAMPEP_0172400452 /NCGR_PEP_ID=MMETSP1061-20121228/46011_1 /TAXON_ID=37318 /ORGANISM="Pseudo-nitzschia pungens, Strain cf. pungens" /LENGTH=69 /DNA_ID=CAMNT_0013133711 /DNA_START=358 /DNA_END=567 /DNA_ORIENTATION=-